MTIAKKWERSHKILVKKVSTQISTRTRIRKLMKRFYQGSEWEMSDTKTSEKAERPLKRMPSPFLLYSNRTTTTYSKTLKPPIFFWIHKFCVIFSLIPNFLKVQIWSLKLKKGTVWSLFFFYVIWCWDIQFLGSNWTNIFYWPKSNQKLKSN